MVVVVASNPFLLITKFQEHVKHTKNYTDVAYLYVFIDICVYCTHKYIRGYLLCVCLLFFFKFNDILTYTRHIHTHAH